MQQMQLLASDGGGHVRLHVSDGVVNDAHGVSPAGGELQERAAPVVGDGCRATYPKVTSVSTSWLTACLEIPMRATRSRPLSPGSVCASALSAQTPRWGRSPKPAASSAPATGAA